MMEQGNDCERILFTAEDIAAQVKKAAAWLDERFEGTVPLAVSVLKGSVIFFCDLVRALMKTPVQMDFMTLSSYGSGSSSSGMPKIVMDLSAPRGGAGRAARRRHCRQRSYARQAQRAVGGQRGEVVHRRVAFG